MQVFKKGHLWNVAVLMPLPHSEWLITAHLERIWNQHFGALGCHITTWWNTCKSSKRSSWNVAVLMPLPVRVAYHGSFRENLESAFWGLGLSYHNLIKHMQVFKTEQLKCCSFDASPQSEWLITAHLERIWNQHFGALDCHITTWWSTCKPSKRSSWNVAVLMPLPVSVAYHGSFRENLESAFWGFGLSYHSLIRQMQVFKKGTSEMLQFWCLSPVRVAYHGSFRENLESDMGLWSVISQLD